ncbi:fibronectin type III domain-containing protein [Siphonobacter aquaeclarae]|uniref:Fibronectin type III domain-containing protein n=1 Tax=Siphonobacter aquaeclarae TaxID=563176 RepID=A0A1G9RSU6_9BACT|nr:fibronectin type III domain-containing protein [Siphonobacter aquaeclarae]SDM26150.1 Fibronectin type III domain-containing protein [Siphonobacter aquaeclarae]
MKRIGLFLVFLATVSGAGAQERKGAVVYTGIVPGKNEIQVKWLLTIGFKSRYHVYRKGPGEKQFRKLTRVPLEAEPPLPVSEQRYTGKYSRSELEYSRAAMNVPKEKKALRAYTETVALQAYSDTRFAQLAGMYYKDVLVKPGETYQYGIAMIWEGKEMTMGFSEPITVKPFEAPPSPAALVLEQLSAGTISMKWTYNRHFINYHVYRKKGSEPERQITKTAIAVPEFINGKTPDTFYADSDTLKREGETYTYRVAAMDAFGNPGYYSQPATLTLKDITPPAAPANLIAVRNNRDVRLSWRPSRSADCKGYSLYRKASLHDTYMKISTLAQKDTVYVDRQPTEGAGYYYYLEAEDVAGNRQSTMPVSVTLADLTPPAMPAGLTARTDTGKIVLSWKPNTEKDLEGYLVYRALKDDPDNYAQLFRLPQKATTFLDTLPKTHRNRFFYRVTALDKQRNESAPAVLSASMPDAVPPPPPVLGIPEVQGGKLAFSWTSSTDVAAFDVYRDDVCLAAAIRTHRFSEPVPGQRAAYRVVAIDSAGNRSVPSVMREYLPEQRDLAPPTDVSLKFDGQALQVRWQAAPQPEGFRGYRVVVRSGTGAFEPVTPLLQESQAVLSDLQENTDYEIRVVAESAEGEKRFSLPVKTKSK